MKNVAVAFLLLLFPAVCMAGNTSGAETGKIVGELEALHAAGVDLHRKYEEAPLAEQVNCVEESRGHLSKARDLKNRAQQRLDAATLRKLEPALKAAYSCVYCGDTMKECDRMLQVIKKVRLSTGAASPVKTGTVAAAEPVVR